MSAIAQMDIEVFDHAAGHCGVELARAVVAADAWKPGQAVTGRRSSAWLKVGLDGFVGG